MSESDHETIGWRTSPMYTFSEAARFAGVHPVTVRRWLYGYESSTGQMQPVFGLPSAEKALGAVVSFLQLVEIVVVGRFRNKRVTLQRMRRAHQFSRERFGLDYPFASLRLKTDGRHVLQEFENSEPGASLLSLDQAGQLTLPGGVVQLIDSFEFEGRLAARWFPLGKDVPIVIDPEFGGGRPTIPHRRLMVETIHQRWLAGQKIAFIADDFELEPPLVEDVLRYAERYAA